MLFKHLIVRDPDICRTVISSEHRQVSAPKYTKTPDANIWKTRYQFSKSKYGNGWRIWFTPDILQSTTLFVLVNSSRKDAKQQMFYPVTLLFNSLISLYFTILPWSSVFELGGSIRISNFYLRSIAIVNKRFE